MNANLPDDAWLLRNRNLRMDANSAIFRDGERRIFSERYEFARSYCAGKSVLDGACGTGYGSSVLGISARQVVGIDSSAEAVEYAGRKYATANISFRQSFVELTPFDSDSFDVVVSFETVEHTLCPRSHLMEIARLLEPREGCAILSIPNGWGYTDHHFFDFTLELLRQIGSEFFSEIEYYSQDFDPPGIRRVPDGGRKPHCIIAVCSGPRKDRIVENKVPYVLNEVYSTAFSRHLDFLALQYRVNTSLMQRVINWLRAR